MGEHDHIFKRAFRIPEHAAGEFLAVLPRELAALLDPASLALVETDHVSRKLQERFSDALFSARFRDVPGFIWLLLEHQSEPDHWIVLRVLEHLTESWMRIHELEPTRKTLPPVVCVIVHHGERGWHEPTSLHTLVEGLGELPELARFIPNFDILVDDLCTQPDDALKQRQLPLFPKVVLWALRDARTIQRFYQRLVTWATELERLARESPEDFGTLMRYIWEAAGDEPFETIQRKIIEVAPTTEQAMASPAQQLINRGRDEGKLEGKTEGKAEAVLAFLEERGITLRAEERARILQCKNIDELNRWVRKAAKVNSVAELFTT